MTFKQKISDAAQYVSSLFNNAAGPCPEPVIEQEMVAEGWTFSIYNPILGTAYMIAPVAILFVKTPEGRPALNGGPAPEDKARYLETLAEKRRQHGLKP